jgi:hypothetical protein
MPAGALVPGKTCNRVEGNEPVLEGRADTLVEKLYDAVNRGRRKV